MMPTAPPKRITADWTQVPDHAQSSEARNLRGLLAAQREHQRQRTVFADLNALWNEARTDDWAGRPGKALMPGAFWQAEAFLEAVQMLAPPPALTVDNSGAVELDWILARRHRISISISASGEIIYTFRIGDDRFGSGAERFHGVLPPRLAELIAEVTSAPTSATGA